MDLDLTTLKVFDNSPEAHVYRIKLENEGIKCFLYDEEMITLDPLLNLALGGIKLKINKIDLPRANEVISNIENKPITDENNELVKCPNCNSTDLFSDFKSMKGVKGIISTIITFLFMAYPLYYKSVYKCKECNTEFKRKNK